MLTVKSSWLPYKGILTEGARYRTGGRTIWLLLRGGVIIATYASQVQALKARNRLYDQIDPWRHA